MREIKVKTLLIEQAAKIAKTTPEKFVGDSRSVSCGRKVCAHFTKKEGDYSFFSLVDSVRTLDGAGDSSGARKKKAS